MAISFDSVKAEEDGINVRLWDFLFYMSFGFVITSSVAIAGVFLVFSYLVIPAVGAMLLSDKLSTRLLIGWVGGAIVSLLGVKLSWDTGLPTSPLVVCLLALALILSAIVRYVKTAQRPSIAVRNLAVYAVVASFFISGVFFFRKAQEDPLEHTIHMLSSNMSTDRLTALANLEGFPDHKDQWLPLVLQRLQDDDAEVRRSTVDLLVKLQERGMLEEIIRLLNDKSDQVRNSVLNAVRTLGETRHGEELIRAYEYEDDPEMKVAFLATALELGNASAILPLVEVVRENGIFAEDAYHALRSHVQLEFAKTEIEKFLTWWKTNQNRIIWNGATRMFVLQLGQEKHG